MKRKQKMRAYRNYLDYAGTVRAWTVRARSTARWVGVQRLVVLLDRHLDRARLRRELRQIEHLGDWLLKDTGLYHERLPGGGTRIRRR